MARSADPRLEIVTGSTFRRTIMGLPQTKICRKIFILGDRAEYGYLIWVVFKRHLPISLFDLIVSRPLDDAKHLERSGDPFLFSFHLAHWQLVVKINM